MGDAIHINSTETLNKLKAHPAQLVILSGVVAALHIGKMPPAIPVLRDLLSVTLVEAGFLLSMSQLAGMLAGVLVGLAADGLGLRRSVLTGLTVLCVASLAGMWASEPAHLLWLRALEGLGVLLVVLPAPSLVRRLVPAQHLARYLGVWGAYMPTGTALALLLGPWVIATIGWQGLWGGLAAFTGAMAAWVLASVPADPLRAPKAPHPTAGLAAQVSAPASATPGEAWPRRLQVTLSAPGPWLVALAFAMYSSQWLAVIGFLPSVYAVAGIPGHWAGLMTAAVCAANIAGNVGAGQLLHRGLKPEQLLQVGFASMATTAFLAFSPVTEPFPVLRYGAVVLFSALGGMVPGTLFSLAVRVAPSEHTVSTTVGWMQQCSSTGQFLGPPLVAWVAAQVGGWHWTWLVTGTASLGGWLLTRALCHQALR